MRQRQVVITTDLQGFKWHATQMTVLRFARRTSVYYNIKNARSVCTLQTTHHLQNIIRDDRDVFVCLTLHLLSVQYHFLASRSTTAARTGKTRSARTITMHARPVVTKVELSPNGLINGNKVFFGVRMISS